MNDDLWELYWDFLADHIYRAIDDVHFSEGILHFTRYYHPTLDKYIKWKCDDLDDNIFELYDLRDENGLLPDDLQMLFNEWILRERL